MINKITCWLWGHEFFEDYFTGEYGREPVINPITLIPYMIPIMHRLEKDKCRRCGVEQNKTK